MKKKPQTPVEPVMPQKLPPIGGPKEPQLEPKRPLPFDPIEKVVPRNEAKRGIGSVLVEFKRK